MGEAIRSAEMSSVYGDYPIGAVLSDGKTIHHGFNRVQTTPSPLAHAECDAIRTLTEELRTKYLTGWTLYTTVEPCAMCLTAAYWAGIKRVVYGLSQNQYVAQASQYADGFFRYRTCPIMSSPWGRAAYVQLGIQSSSVLKEATIRRLHETIQSNRKVSVSGRHNVRNRVLQKVGKPRNPKRGPHRMG